MTWVDAHIAAYFSRIVGDRAPSTLEAASSTGAQCATARYCEELVLMARRRY